MRTHNITMTVTVAVRDDAEFFERDFALTNPAMAVEDELRSHFEDLGAAVFIDVSDSSITNDPD